MSAAGWTPNSIYRLTLSAHFTLSDATATVHIAAERGYDTIRISPVVYLVEDRAGATCELTKLADRAHELGLRLVLDWEPEVGDGLFSQQDPAASPQFEEIHAPLIEWIRAGVVDGVCIRHVDSLPDPQKYISRISEYAPFVLTEKRLSVFAQGTREVAPASWAASAAASYPFISAIDGALTHLDGFYRYEALRQALAADSQLTEEALADIPDVATMLRRNPTSVTGLLTQIETTAKRYVAANDLHERMHELATLTRQAWAHLGEETRDLIGADPTQDVSDEQLADLYSTLAAAIPVARTDTQQEEHDSDIFLSIFRSDGSADFFTSGRTGATGEVPALTSSAAIIARALSRVRSMARVQVVSDRLLAYLGLLLTTPHTPVAVRFAQTTSLVIIHGLTERAHYRYCALAGLNEVGGSPARPRGFDGLLTEFEILARAREDGHPSVVALTTPLTKFTAQERARAIALSEVPDEFARFMRVAQALAPLPSGTRSASIGGAAYLSGEALGVSRERAAEDRSFASYLWQGIIARWDPGQPDDLLRTRIQEDVRIAARRAHKGTSIDDPNMEFEAGLNSLVAQCFDNPRLREALESITALVEAGGRSNAIVARACQLLSPGIPEVYDPNAYPSPGPLPTPSEVAHTRDELKATPEFVTGEATTGEVEVPGLSPIISRLVPVTLDVRTRHAQEVEKAPELLAVAGAERTNVVGFGYRNVAVVGVRLPVGLKMRGGFTTTSVALPAGGRFAKSRWRDVLTGHSFTADEIPVAELLSTYPVAVLERD